MFFSRDVGFQCARVSAQQKHDEISEIDRNIMCLRSRSGGCQAYMPQNCEYLLLKIVNICCSKLWIWGAKPICLYIYIYIMITVMIHVQTAYATSLINTSISLSLSLSITHIYIYICTYTYIYMYIYIHYIYIYMTRGAPSLSGPGPSLSADPRLRWQRSLRLVKQHPVSIARFPLARLSPGSGLLRSRFCP